MKSKIKEIGIPCIIFLTTICCMFLMLGVRSCEDDNTTAETTKYTTTTTTTTSTTTTTTTTTTSTTTTTTTTGIEDIITEMLVTTTDTTTTTAKITTVTGPEDLPDNTTPPFDNLKFLGNYKGTYYPVKGPCNGGSGRILVDCGVNLNDSYKGSIASKYIYKNYGYNHNGKTMVYLKIKEYSEMDGWYSVDDCNGNTKIVDFYYSDAQNCPFQYDGVVHVEMYIAE